MPKILLYGSSILLAGLATQLQSQLNTQVFCHNTLPNLGDLSTLDAVIVDLNDPRTADVLTLLRARSDLKIVGVNAANSAVTVLSGKVYLAQTVEDVVACVTDAEDRQVSD